MSTSNSAVAGRALPHDRTRALLGQVMGLVAVAVGFAALGAYLGRDLSGGTGLLLFIPAFASILGLHFAAARGREQLAIGLLFAMGLLLGLAVAPVIAEYANANPSALWQAAGATAGFVAATGAYGYATRRDLSSWGRTLFWGRWRRRRRDRRQHLPRHLQRLPALPQPVRRARVTGRRCTG
jgi:FtsH-binding integral membrane protein